VKLENLEKGPAANYSVRPEMGDLESAKERKSGPNLKEGQKK